ncbi:peroxisomal leader peptide-processing protease isoform X1 [Anthonomus grandis grandis]|uniref:peroxisomal leader peptide-processing protease isoform X1 n=1 Tax=Anthonomus grandis grandis TaxID=2921223 RepID=UPI0021667D9E|nr:peroxisomal leader peptide-processing protease isoform X1 [Anthonomus grandis grandis]
MFTDLDIQPVLLQAKKKNSAAIVSYSAILLQKQYVISTSHILQELEIPAQDIEVGKLVLCNENFSKKQHFNVVSNEFATISADLFGLFKCKNIDNFFRNDCKDCQVQAHSTNLKEYLSIFVIFSVGNARCSKKNLLMILYSWIEIISQDNIRKGEHILSISSPFGTKIFFNTITEGIVSNAFENSSLFLSDCCSAPGSEGGAVFKRDSYDIPIGIIISPFNWWRKDWVGFTLVADIRPIILQILDVEKKDLLLSGIYRDVSTPSYTIFENCVSQICCGVSWGSCILLEQNKGIFLTNSHVVKPSFKITIFWKNRKMLATLIYRSVDNSPLDLAIVQISKNPHCSLSDMTAVTMTLNAINKGDPVYCVGFPLFSNSFKPRNPTITKGIIGAISPYMLKTTCAVYPGFSGGGVFSPDGILLGIIVCNTRIPEDGMVYPRINMAVPISAVAELLYEFLETGDVSKLTLLDSPSSEAYRSWMPLEAKL